MVSESMTQYDLLEKEVLRKLKTYACFITVITSYEKVIYFYYIRDTASSWETHNAQWFNAWNVLKMFCGVLQYVCLRSKNCCKNVSCSNGVIVRHFC